MAQPTTQPARKPDYRFKHPLYVERLPQWTENRDAYHGEEKVKSLKYIPAPMVYKDPMVDPMNDLRVRRYVDRAVYYNATARTVNGLTGIALSAWPELEIPEKLEYLRDDADGTGLTIYGLCQLAISELLLTGWGGFLVDYPRSEGPKTVAEVEEGFLNARVVWYPAEDIHDWSTVRVGSRNLLSYLKLYEKRFVRSEDGLTLESEEVYRIYRLTKADGAEFLTAGTLQVTLEVVVAKEKGEFVSEGTVTLTDNGGAPLRAIPFEFAGAQTNRPRPASAPMTDIVKVNLGHLRNSADHEHSVFILGQVQVTMTGIDEAWRDHLEKEGVLFGSDWVLTGPQGANIGLLQANPNTLAAAAMEVKVEAMASMGARLIQANGVVKTADQSRSETKASYSVLSLVCDNVSQALTAAMGHVGLFMGTPTDGTVSIPTDFNGLSFNVEVIKAVIEGGLKHVVPMSDVWNVLRAANVIDPEKTDEDIRSEIEQDTDAAMERMINGAMTAGLPRNQPPAGPRQPEPPADVTDNGDA